MCKQTTDEIGNKDVDKSNPPASKISPEESPSPEVATAMKVTPNIKKRRGKRDKVGLPWTSTTSGPGVEENPFRVKKSKKKSKSLQKHGGDSPSGGIESLLPSLAGVAILLCGVMAKMGFRGRASVAGIDLGTTNSVICVQQPSKGVGEIQCIPDPISGSPVIPSVVSFLEASERPHGPKSKVPSTLIPHPSYVVVGQEAKHRIDSHPHHTLYNAKRVVGRSYSDSSVQDLKPEVEFDITSKEDVSDSDVVFRVPNHDSSAVSQHWIIPPHQVGSYVVNHLIDITKTFLGHENVKAAVIAVPAKFDTIQRQATHKAFQDAGVKITRVLEEPTAAALAYGLHKKANVDYILVYDFGGGTLDVSLLYVTDDFVDVMGSDGDDRLGGADFDAAIAHYLLEQQTGSQAVSRVSKVIHHFEHELQKKSPDLDLEDILSSKCPAILQHPLCTVSSFHTIGEQLKIQLSNAYYDKKDDTETIVTAECMTLPQTNSNDDEKIEEDYTIEKFCDSLTSTTLKLSAKEYDDLSADLFNRSVLPIERILKDLNLKIDEIDEVVMVGGTTRMPQIRNLVKEALPTAQLNTHIDPDITVAYGAASVID